MFLRFEVLVADVVVVKEGVPVRNRKTRKAGLVSKMV